MYPKNLIDMIYQERLGVGTNIRGKFLQNLWHQAETLNSIDLKSHYGCVNSVEFSSDGEWMVSGGDDRRVILWNMDLALAGQGYKMCMAAEHRSNIFCLGVDDQMKKIYSGGNDEQVIVHDAESGQPLDYFLHEEPVYGLSVHPQESNLFATACSDGRILLFDIRQQANFEAQMIAGCSYAFHAVHFNPVEPRLLAAANQKFGIGLWDIRKPKACVLKYNSRSTMHVRFNAAGNKLVGIRRRLPPVLFNIESPIHVCEFDNPGYYNSCTMKSCSFGGPNDEYVVSGSDDFNLYMWKVPEDDTSWVDRAHFVLRGHRSIVNQVRYNPQRFLLASSGVEKIVKIWSPLPLTSPGAEDTSTVAERPVYSHEDYIGLALRSDTMSSHDSLTHSTSENPRMMAFFDSLVQREIEGWDSDDDVETQTSLSGSVTDDSDVVAGTADFSHHSIGTRRRMLMERISVSIADDLIREDLSIVEARNTVGANRSADSTDTSAQDSSNLDTSGENPTVSSGSVETLPSSNRIAQLIERKRAHLVKMAKRRGRRARKTAEEVINRSINHARKVIQSSSSRSSSSGLSSDEEYKNIVSSSSESEAEDEILSPPVPSSPLPSPSVLFSDVSPYNSRQNRLPEPDDGPTGDGEGTSGVLQDLSSRLSPVSHGTFGGTQELIGPQTSSTLNGREVSTKQPLNGHSNADSGLDNDGCSRHEGELQSGDPKLKSAEESCSTHRLENRKRSTSGNDVEGRSLESVEHLLPGPSRKASSSFIRSLREKRLRISQGVHDSDDECVPTGQHQKSESQKIHSQQ